MNGSFDEIPDALIWLSVLNCRLEHNGTWPDEATVFNWPMEAYLGLVDFTIPT